MAAEAKHRSYISKRLPLENHSSVAQPDREREGDGGADGERSEERKKQGMKREKRRMEEERAFK